MRTVEEFIVAPTVQAQKLNSPPAHEFQTTLVGMMGHDLRQSLHVIQGTYAPLRSRLQEMPQRAWLDRGERAATKLTEQFNCLVDAFYLAEHVDALEVSSVGLGPLFWQLRDENEDAAIQRAIDIRAFDTKARVISNSLLLRCILHNLITNAIKYTEPGGRILIGCRRRGPEIRIDVYDTASAFQKTSYLESSTHLRASPLDAAMVWASGSLSFVVQSMCLVTASKFDPLWVKGHFSRSTRRLPPHQTQAEVAQ
jgi:two-component system phosphate regulon sensor histidine kinase PhoR